MTKKNIQLQEKIDLIRKNLPNQIAQEICAVQPMDSKEISDALKEMLETSMTESELRQQGYEPIEKNGPGLMWIKKEQ